MLTGDNLVHFTIPSEPMYLPWSCGKLFFTYFNGIFFDRIKRYQNSKYFEVMELMDVFLFLEYSAFLTRNIDVRFDKTWKHTT